MLEAVTPAAARLRHVAPALLLVAALLAAGCASSGGSTSRAAEDAAPTPTARGDAMDKEPDRIKVQHILIGFQGSVPGKNITRSEAEARTLAYQILERAKAGEPFDALVRAHTDDQWPGIYGMANRGVTADRANSEYPREGMVPAFGNVGFKLALNEVGVADYDPTTSPYGYHAIKRVE